MNYNNLMQGMDTKKITIKTVAEFAGVSIKTVSRVLNSEVSVRETTREKVQHAIDHLKYKPSPAAQALAGNQSKIIGLIYENISATYILRMQKGALKACYSNDYSLVIHPCNHLSSGLADELLDLVHGSRLDGLILAPLSENKIPFVRISPALEFAKSFSITSNDSAAVKEVILQLIQMGHKDIAFIKGHKHHGSTQQRFKGYKNAFKAAKLKLNVKLIFDGDFSFESGKDLAKKILSKSKKPTAIFACNDYMAAGVLYTASEMNIKVPDDLSVIGFDNAPVSYQISPSLTTIKQPIESMSEAAAKFLIDYCKEPKTIKEQTTFTAELLLRESHKTLLR